MSHMERVGCRSTPYAVAFTLGCCVAFWQTGSGCWGNNTKPIPAPDLRAESLPGTALLNDLPPDPAAEMVAGLDRFALALIDQAAAVRQEKFWRQADSKSQNLAFLERQLGLQYLRDEPAGQEPASSPRRAARSEILTSPEPLWESELLTIRAIRWPVARHPAPQLQRMITVWGEGLLLTPRAPRDLLAVVVPDPETSLEAVAGLTAEPAPGTALVRQLIAQGSPVAVVQLVSREIVPHGHVELAKREYLHRAAYELGLTLNGYEVAAIQGLLDQLPAEQTILIGYGEGGRLGLLSGAIDERLDALVVCGYFGPREACWQEPLDRNLFGVLSRFGDAELAAMIAPRNLWVVTTPTYQVQSATRGAAPATWRSPNREESEAEFLRIADCLPDNQHAADFATWWHTGVDDPDLQSHWLTELGWGPRVAPQSWPALESTLIEGLSSERMGRLVAGIDAHTQAVLEECDYARTKFVNMGLPRDDLPDGSNRLTTNSLPEYAASIEPLRRKFASEVIGELDTPRLDPRPRSRANYRGQGWTGYDVVLDLFPDVFAYGVLLVPDDVTAGERRPVVVCQHGLEGRPTDTMLGDHAAYHDFAAKLAEQGFIVFAPQNPYIGEDSFRTLQRKLNPLGKSLFSVIAAQHQQILDWLSSLPFIDPQRIAFYGLSYGGKSAMRLPALLPQYCLSICSADFNDWVWKNASTRSPYSYVGTGEYEIFEFDLGHRFNYAEMAALIAPRPFMVERGHFDGVAPDDRVAKEFARVRFLYNARLQIPERCHIEWFVGPHTIHGQDSFAFLHKHLAW